MTASRQHSQRSTQAQKFRRIREGIARERLSIARQKFKIRREREVDTRQKIKFGGLVELAGLDAISIDQLDKLLENISISEAEISYLEKIGEDKLTSRKKPHDFLSKEKYKEYMHDKITRGGLIVKYGLGRYRNAAILGILHHKVSAKAFSSNR